MKQLRQIDDPSVAVDLVRAGLLQSGGVDLECATALLPTLSGLLSSRHEEYQVAALDAVSHMLTGFGPLISANRAVLPDAVGVDLSAEARQRRCVACFEEFAAMGAQLRQLESCGGHAGLSATAILKAMSATFGSD